MYKRLLLQAALVCGNYSVSNIPDCIAHVHVCRYVIEDDRILIQIDDGSDSIQIRDFLLEQENCLDVTVDSKTYDGKGKKVGSACHSVSELRGEDFISQ